MIDGWLALIIVSRVVKNYVPHTPETMYPVLLKPGTPYSRNHVPQARNNVPSTLDTMCTSIRNLLIKVEQPPQCIKIKVKALSFQYNTTRERYRTTFVFFFSILNLRHSVSDKFDHLHHFEFHRLFLEYQVSTWVLKAETINIFLCWRVKGLTPIFKYWWVIFGGLFFFSLVKFLMEVHGFEGTQYIVSSLGCRVHGFKATGIWFREYGVHSFETTGYG